MSDYRVVPVDLLERARNLMEDTPGSRGDCRAALDAILSRPAPEGETPEMACPECGKHFRHLPGCSRFVAPKGETVQVPRADAVKLEDDLQMIHMWADDSANRTFCGPLTKEQRLSAIHDMAKCCREILRDGLSRSRTDD